MQTSEITHTVIQQANVVYNDDDAIEITSNTDCA